MYQSTAAASSAFNSAAGGREGTFRISWHHWSPSAAPPNQPEVLQTPDDVGRFGDPAALDEPSHRAAVILEIVAHAVQPFGLRKSDQPLGRTPASPVQ